jgi:hypothetical protein
MPQKSDAEHVLVLIRSVSDRLESPLTKIERRKGWTRTTKAKWCKLLKSIGNAIKVHRDTLPDGTRITDLSMVYGLDYAGISSGTLHEEICEVGDAISIYFSTKTIE